MKSFSILRAFFALSAFLFALPLFAATLVVNNTNPGPGQYTVIDSAIAAASPGDKILILGSSVAYAGFTVNKSNLSFYGSGVFPQGAQATSTYASGSTTLEGGVTGCNFYGIIFDYLGTYASNVHNIVVENCYFNQYLFIQSAGSANWLIRNCVFFGGYQNVVVSNGSGIILEYNVFDGYLNMGNGQPTGILVRNNLFLSGANAPIQNLQFASVENNIFHTVWSATANVSNCTFNNNMTDLDSLSNTQDNILPPAGNSGAGNILRAVPVFVQGVPSSMEGYNSGTWYWNPFGRNYRLQTGSPGKGAATNGGDLGLYGGTVGTGGVNLFSETMEPLLPTVQDLNILGSTVPSGGTLNITLNLRNRVTEVN